MLSRRKASRRAIALLRTAVAAFSLFAGGGVGLAIGVDDAYAGQWVQVSCVNPNGSAAPNQGWSSFSAAVTHGSSSDVNCRPGSPMSASLSTAAAASVGEQETLEYEPPAGSTLTGGEVSVSLAGEGSGYQASGTAIAYSPAFAYDSSDVIFQCAEGLGPCQGGSYQYNGTLSLPSGRGGNFFLSAGCGGLAGSSCEEGGAGGAWSSVALQWADFLLSNASTPTAGNFGGTLLSADAHGTATLAFTAADPGGPGVYTVTVLIDGTTRCSGTANTNGGQCAPVGSSSGALMFDSQQPCLPSEAVDIPIDTTALRDGTHELKVIVSDAAQNTSTVLDQTITTNNLATVSARLNSPLPPSAAAPSEPVAPPTYTAVLDPATASLQRGVSTPFSKSGLSLSGVVHTTSGVAAPGVVVSLLARAGNPPASAARVVAQSTSDATGRWVLHAPRGLSRLLQVVYGDPAQATAASTLASIRQTMQPNLTLSIKSHHGVLHFTGRVMPAQITPAPTLVIEVQRGGHTAQSVGLPVYATRNGTYSVTYNAGPQTVGNTFTFRAITAAQSGQYAPANSAWQRAQVH